MSARPSWSGFLQFNMISIPVKGYNAAAGGGGKIGFHLLHAKCHERIRYKKVCPVHGEVSNDEIVSGYEVSKGQYAVVEKEEREGVKIEDDKTISMDAFVRPQAIDPVYYSGRTYFLVPDGKVGQKPYGVMLDAMREQVRYAIAHVVFAGRAQLAIVHPTGQILAMTLIRYESELKKSSAFEDEVHEAAASTEERKLAQTLIDAATADQFDVSQYKDEYAGRLAKLVEGKARRTKKRAGLTHDEPVVINLMEALRQSLDRTRKGHARAASKKSPNRAGKKAAVQGRRKTG